MSDFGRDFIEAMRTEPKGETIDAVLTDTRSNATMSDFIPGLRCWESAYISASGETRREWSYKGHLIVTMSDLEKGVTRYKTGTIQFGFAGSLQGAMEQAVANIEATISATKAGIE